MSEFIIPTILQCNHFKLKSTIKNMRRVKDYEFDFYLSGERDMYIDDRYHKITKGILVFRKPGQIVVGYGDYDCYTLSLDFSHTVNIPPDVYLRHRDTPQQPTVEMPLLDEIPDTFYPYHQEELLEIYKRMISCSYPSIINPEEQKKYITEFLLLVLSDVHRYKRKVVEASQKSHIERACRFINENYQKNISLDDISGEVHLNKSYLIRLFKKELSTTPNHYLNETRLFYAKNMLLQSNLSINEIGKACGFSDPAYFSKCFKACFNKTPAEYKKLYLPER